MKITLVPSTTEAGTGTYTTSVAPTTFDNIMAAVQAPILASNEALDSSSAFWASAGWGFAGSVAGGMLARNRASKGDGPMLGFLF